MAIVRWKVAGGGKYKIAQIIRRTLKIPFAIHFEGSTAAPTIASGRVVIYSRERVAAVGFCAAVMPVADTAACKRFVTELPRWPGKKAVATLYKLLNVCQGLTLTAQTGSRVSPTRNVMSHSSGMDARNLRSSARPDLFSKIDSDSSWESDSVPIG